MSGILGSAGRPMVAIGGKHAWKNFKKGDIAISLQWLDLGNDMPEPCMCIYPANNALMMNVGAYVVAQSAAWHYVDAKTGEPSKKLLLNAAKAVAHMGMFTDRFTLFRVCDAIAETVPDLLDMPDLPEAALEKRLFEKPKLGAEIRVSVGGELMAEGEL